MAKGKPKKLKVENKKAILKRIYVKSWIKYEDIYLRAEIKEQGIGIDKRVT